MTAAPWVALGLMLAAAPALPGIVNRTKNLLTGRRGAPVTQLYRDLAKLWRKGTVYSRTTTAVFRVAPVLLLAATAAAACLLPLDGRSAPLTFTGDFVAFAGLLALGRFALVLAALDTGSSFEGMGASREVFFSTLAEPTLFLSLSVLAIPAEGPSLAAIAAAVSPGAWHGLGPAILLAAAALLVVLLAENARVPVDDPATHLELTMIHEVMVLDHGGPDFAFIQYGAAMKLLVTGSLVALPFLPSDMGALPNAAVFLLAMLALAVAVGVIESTMARLRLVRVPLLLLGAFVVSAIAVALAVAGRG